MSANEIVLYNSLGRALQPFEPIEPSRVRLYSCGPTVYNYAHIGNLRAYLFTDSLRRTLQWKGFDVLHVMNITDVGHLTDDADEGEDKMEVASRRQGKNIWDIAAHFTSDFLANLADLNILPATSMPRATEYIGEMIEFACVCQERGYTYELDSGLYFDTSKVPRYGELGILEVSALREGARIGVVEGRRNPSDFVLWRRSSPDERRLMEWDSPWGRGAPGWHLECSVMSSKLLGLPFDIHTGGVDHRQLHHCNEIAQNQAFAACGDPGARFWLHNEFLIADAAKMSKSSGDFLRLQTLRDAGIHPHVYRLFALMAHYRSQLEISLAALAAAKRSLRRMLFRVRELMQHADVDALYRLLSVTRFSRGAGFGYARRALEAAIPGEDQPWIARLDDAISRDLNTPAAIAHLTELLGRNDGDPDVVLRIVASYELALGLGLFDLEPSDLEVRPASASLSVKEVEQLIDERARARETKDWARADAIRDRLTAAGVMLMDGSGGDWGWKLGDDL